MKDIAFFKDITKKDVARAGEIIFIDYNRLPPTFIAPPTPFAFDHGQRLHGAVAFPGQVTGIVRIVAPEAIATIEFFSGDILVCDNTDVRYLPLMKKAGAIVTERGGVLSHAAIVARELKKPCIIGVKNVMRILSNGDRVKVNANDGMINQLSP